MTKSKTHKISTLIGCSLLTIMALFHGSGILYISNLVQKSDITPFVKEIFPILFAHPSIQLLGLSGLGVLTLFMKHEIEKITFFIALMVFINAMLAFYLGATIPGVLLIFSSLIFTIGGINKIK